MTSKRSTGKRARGQAALSAVLDDDDALFGDADGLPVRDADFNEVSFRKLQRAVNNAEPESKVPPYFLWSDRQKELHRDMIGRMAAQIQQRAVVPNDKQLHEQMRRLEASRAGEQGYASVSLLDTRQPDPDYATRMLRLGDTAPRRIGGAVDHAHQKEMARVLELRYANNLDRLRPVPRDIVQSERFSDCCIPVDSERAFHSLNTYAQALGIGRKLETLQTLKRHSTASTSTSATAESKSTAQPLSAFLSTLRAECAMPLFCVRFLYDATLEVCLYMEATGAYFAVFAFDFTDEVKFRARQENTTFDEATRRVRAKIASEIAAERAKSEKRIDAVTKLLDAPIESLSTEQVVERTAMLKDEREFRSLIDRFHVRFEDELRDAPADSEERKIGAFVALAVFAVEKSESLRKLACRYLYVYFANCQCLTDAETPSATSTTTTTNTSSIVNGTLLTTSVGFGTTQTTAAQQKR